MSSKRNKFLKAILLGLIVIFCAATIWSIFKWYRLRNTSQLFPSQNLESSEGWKVSKSIGNQKIYDVSIKSFSIEKAKLGPFAIGPLNVARLERVVVDMYAEGLSSKADAGKDPSQSETFKIDALKDLLADVKNDLFSRSRKINILDIDGISLNLWEGKKRAFQISSNRATLDRKTGDIIFTGHASLDAAENGRVISHRIRWVRKSSLFRIKDPFILTKGNEKKEGRELETDHLLKTIQYQIKN